MKTINENNLSISEFQDFNELNAEELEEVSGGGVMGFVAGGAIGGLLGMGGYVGTWGYNKLTGHPKNFDIHEMNDKGVDGLVKGAIGVGVASLLV